jgi:hypothetical protein
MFLAHFLFLTGWFFAVIFFFKKLLAEVFSLISSFFGLPLLPNLLFMLFYFFYFPISFNRYSLKFFVQGFIILYMFYV